jgi:hypothetical protein
MGFHGEISDLPFERYMGKNLGLWQHQSLGQHSSMSDRAYTKPTIKEGSSKLELAWLEYMSRVTLTLELFQLLRRKLIFRCCAACTKNLFWIASRQRGAPRLYPWSRRVDTVMIWLELAKSRAVSLLSWSCGSPRWIQCNCL